MINKENFYRYVLLTFIFLARTSYSQQLPLSPPPEIVSAAVAAFPEYGNGTDFDQILKSGTSFPSPIIIARTFDPDSGASVFGRDAYPSPYISKLVSRSNFVGEGVALKRWTYPTIDHNFAVSIYLVKVNIRAVPEGNALASPLSIYIARAGGPFEYRGHLFRAIDPNFQLLHLNQPYLFFASQLAPGLYKIDSEQVLQIQDQTLAETSKAKRYSAYFARHNKEDIEKEAFAAWQNLRSAGVK